MSLLVHAAYRHPEHHALQEDSSGGWRCSAGIPLPIGEHRPQVGGRWVATFDLCHTYDMMMLSLVTRVAEGDWFAPVSADIPGWSYWRQDAQLHSTGRNYLCCMLPWWCYHGDITIVMLPWWHYHSDVTMVMLPWWCYHGNVTCWSCFAGGPQVGGYDKSIFRCQSQERDSGIQVVCVCACVCVWEGVWVGSLQRLVVTYDQVPSLHTDCVAAIVTTSKSQL